MKNKQVRRSAANPVIFKRDLTDKKQVARVSICANRYSTTYFRGDDGKLRVTSWFIPIGKREIQDVQKFGRAMRKNAEVEVVSINCKERKIPVDYTIEPLQDAESNL